MTPAYRNSLALLLLAALALRLTAGWWWQSRLDDRFAMGDSESYWTLAQTIAEGKPYEYGADHARVFRTPGYPLLLAPVVGLAGEGRNGVLLARAEAALLGVLAVLVLWWLTRLLFDDRAALWAAAMASFYPGAIAASMLVLSEAPFCPLMLLQLALWLKAWRAPSGRQAAIYACCGGLAAGAATLMRPSWLLFTPLAAGAGMLACGTKRSAAETVSDVAQPPSAVKTTRHSRGRLCYSRHFQIACWMLLGLIVTMLPWWVRNARLTGRFVPTTLQVGASLYDGLNPNATGGSNMDFVPRFVAEERRAATRSTAAPARSTAAPARSTAAPARSTAAPGCAEIAFELRLDRRMWEAAIAWARTNPARAVQLAGIKFLRIWNVWPNEPRLSTWPIRLLVLFTYTPLLVFCLLGTWKTIGRGWPPYVLCWLPAVYLTLLHMVFVSSIRYREPAMLALLALAAGEIGVRNWGLGIRKKRDLGI